MERNIIIRVVGTHLHPAYNCGLPVRTIMENAILICMETTALSWLCKNNVTLKTSDPNLQFILHRFLVI